MARNEWTEDDKARMDKAASDAEAELMGLLKQDPPATAFDLLDFHLRWYLTAGHKRLGKLYRDTAKAVASE